MLLPVYSTGKKPLALSGRLADAAPDRGAVPITRGSSARCSGSWARPAAGGVDVN